jgi:hypothetical protein
MFGWMCVPNGLRHRRAGMPRTSQVFECARITESFLAVGGTLVGIACRMWRNYILLATLIGMFSKGIATDAPLVVIGFRTHEEAYTSKAVLEQRADPTVLKQYAHQAGYTVVERGQVIYLFPPSVTPLERLSDSVRCCE